MVEPASSPLAPAGSQLAPQDGQQTPASPYSPAFRYADAFTAVKEGGRTKNDGTGRAAAFGIDQRAHPELDISKLTPQEAQGIRYQYWKAINGDELAKISPKAAMIAYDTAIMAGPKVAVELIRRSNGDPAAMYSARVNFMNDLIKKDPAKFGPVAANWASRNDDLGKVAGVIEGKANMPDLEQIAKNGLYIPGSYMQEKQTQLASNTREEAARPQGVMDKIGQDFKQGSEDQNVKKAEQTAPQTPKMDPLHPTVAMPQQIAEDKNASYARALEKIAQRQAHNVPQPTPAVTPPVSTPPKEFMQAPKEAENERQPEQTS